MNFKPELIQAIVGCVFLMVLSLFFSENKKLVNWKLVLSAFFLQNILFLLIRYVPIVNLTISGFSNTLVSLLGFAQSGASFIFGDFADQKRYGFAFLLVVVPTLVFFGSLVGILYFFGIIQKLISLLAFILRKSLKISGVESLVVIADIFLGQSEGPLIIGPYVKDMTRSELACAFIAGLANLSGSTLGIYLTFLSQGDYAQKVLFANYLVTATFMNAASAIIFAKILFPETEFSKTSHQKLKLDSHFTSNLLDSIVTGALTGLKIAAAMIAVLIAVISLIHLVDGILESVGNYVHINNYINNSTHGAFNSLSLEYILGQIFRVFAFFMGISWSETLNVGSLLGQKVAINEFVAYVSLGKMKAANLLSNNAIFISSFALSSFSNFSSIGISMATYGVLAPNRQIELTTIAWRALFGAVLAGFMTATIAGFWHLLLG